MEISSTKKDLVKHFDELRQKLLDLSMRNRLINFKPGKRSIQAVDEISTEIYDLLVLKEKPMQFLPKQYEPEDNGENLEDSFLTDEEAEILWELPKPDVNVADRHVDLNLQTKLSSKELQRRLTIIFRESKSVFEEQGYNILYLALGLLEWKQSSDEIQYHKAPLILIPVTLFRKKLGSPFKLKWSGEDIYTNISLKAKLEEQGIDLPEFEMPDKKEGIYDYFQAVKNSISNKGEWNVLNDIYLSFFSFNKFVMYQDLDPKNWPENYSFDKNPIIKDLFNPDEDETIFSFSDKDVDKKLKACNIYNVLNADSSQIAVIEDVKLGNNLVVEGPPGTGKSQTIVNLIAELMAAGKSILFVSEKMAALEVVKNRLDHIGLGEFCLELHSHKSNKKEVLNQLQKIIHKPVEDPLPIDDKFNEIDQLKQELNGYSDTIHKPAGNIEFTPFQLYGIKEAALLHFHKKGKEMPCFLIENSENISRKAWHKSINKLEDVKASLKKLIPITNHPWKYSKPDTILPADKNIIISLLNDSIEDIKDLQSKISTLVELTGIPIPNTINQLNESLILAEYVANAEKVEIDVLKNSDWDGINENAHHIIETLKDLEIKTQNYQPDILNKDLVNIKDNYTNLSKKPRLLKIFSRDYKNAKKDIQTFYIKNAPKDDELLIKNLDNLIEYKDTINSLDNPQYHALTNFGIKWKGIETNYQELIEFSDWIKDFRNKLNNGILTENTIVILNNGPKKDSIINEVDVIVSSYNNLKNTIQKIQNYLKIDFKALFGNDLEHVDFTIISNQMNLFKNEISKLLIWSQYRTLRKNLPKITDPVIELIEEDDIETDDIIPCFKGNFADNLLKIVFDNNPSLSNFMGDVHENKIKKFRKLDKELLHLNRERIKQSISSKKPSKEIKVSPNSELGILLGEFNRKRRHMPIRKLLSVTGDFIKKIKPCFMMSPLSVAQFIDPNNVESLKFDVVIFDEASQVKPEDALGAFLRGEKLVVMGDTKQLPPTSFFDSISESEDDEDYETSTLMDMESILHLCKRSFPTKMLKWHYRSRHESLIAVSNHLFYDNQLLIYPSPSNNSDNLGLKFINQPETVYDRGRSSGNNLEAKTIVKEVIKHYKQYKNTKSLGIGTFNQNQRRLIEDYLEIELKNNPDMEEYIGDKGFEKFFIKNLETIQGDERDVIFVSVGFGFDSNHKLHQNFGPINNDGGERRLNVLFTRAREKCVIFSNFRYSNLKVGENTPFGVRALKSYLEYAETRQLVAHEPPGSDTDSPFEDSVYEFLKDNGYKVHKQVGCAGFRIDLAIINPEAQGEYLIGIECDGATYHSSPVARDRDRLRQEILEGLGWKIHRVWSTDWFKNKINTSKNLLEVIEKSKVIEIPTENKDEIEDSIDIESSDNEVVLEENVEENFEKFQVKSLEDSIEPYKTCTKLQIDTNCEFQKISPENLVPAILSVVYDESPVHMDEVIKRIRTFWGLKKSGRIIKEKIRDSAEKASQHGQIKIKDDFLYKTNKEIVVRRRLKNPSAKKNPSAEINLISPEEIACALKLVIETQYATPPEDLIPQTAHLFGFKNTSKNISAKIRDVLNKLIEEGELIKMPNGMINFPKN